MVVDIAAVDDFSIQFTKVIGKSDRVVFYFLPIRANYQEFTFFRPIIEQGKYLTIDYQKTLQQKFTLANPLGFLDESYILESHFRPTEAHRNKRRIHIPVKSKLKIKNSSITYYNNLRYYEPSASEEKRANVTRI